MGNTVSEKVEERELKDIGIRTRDMSEAKEPVRQETVKQDDAKIEEMVEEKVVDVKNEIVEQNENVGEKKDEVFEVVSGVVSDIVSGVVSGIVSDVKNVNQSGEEGNGDESEDEDESEDDDEDEDESEEVKDDVFVPSGDRYVIIQDRKILGITNSLGDAKIMVARKTDEYLMWPNEFYLLVDELKYVLYKKPSYCIFMGYDTIETIFSIVKTTEYKIECKISSS